MNFYILVEGEVDERRIYSEWFKQFFPNMSQVGRLPDVAQNHYFIFSAKSHSVLTKTDRIRKSMEDVAAHGNIDRFFVCLDAESMSYEARFRRVQQTVHEAMIDTKIKEHIPNFREHIIIQNVCIETWFLGNVHVVNAVSNHVAVKPLKDSYDVTTLDPEDLPHDPRFKVRAQFHKHYLRQVLHAHNRKFPGIAQDPEYTQALQHRCASTNHLRSLRRLFDVLHNP